MLHLNQNSYEDLVFINDLVINTTIGVNDWERKIKQPVVLSLAISTDFSKAVKQDDIALTVDYQLIINHIMDFCHNNSFNLLESLVAAIEQLVISKYPKNIIKLEVSAKKLFVLTNAKEVGVKIARTYTDS